MPTETVFQTHLVLGYVAWLLCFGVYIWPRLKAMDHFEAQRAIATLHSFRFFGLVFILPGVVSPDLPASFASFAAYWDFATGVLAMLALLTVRIRPLFWLFVVAFNLVGFVDLIVDYYHAIQAGLPAHGGAVGRRLRDPDHLRAAADDHARRRVLFSAACSARPGLRPGRCVLTCRAQWLAARRAPRIAPPRKLPRFDLRHGDDHRKPLTEANLNSFRKCR